VEALRRRWKVLGIDTSDSQARVGGEGSFGPDGEDARRAISSGELVVQALNSALKGIEGDEIDGLRFRRELVDLFRVYPSDLRGRCLGVVYEDLEKYAEELTAIGAQARMILLTRGLYDREYDVDMEDKSGIILSGVELVEELGKIGKEIRGITKEGGPDFLGVAGEWLARRIDEFKENIELVSLVYDLTYCRPCSSPIERLSIIHPYFVGFS